MKKQIRSAARILRTEGIRYLTSTVRAYYGSKLWELYYRFKDLLGISVVTIHGVRIETDFDCISASMISSLRRKEYEMPETELLRTQLQTGIPVIDLGAGIGYSACLADELTGDDMTIAVEANPDLIPVCERTNQLNKASIDVVHAAYGSGGEPVDLTVGVDFCSSTTYNRDFDALKSERVETVSLATLRRECEIGYFQLIVDIEGGKFDLLDHELDVLVDACHTLFVEFHSYTNHDVEAYRTRLTNNGFERIDKEEAVECYRNATLDMSNEDDDDQ